MEELSTRALEAAEEILEYLIRNPEARDSSEGIQMWWLSWRVRIRAFPDKDLVQQALDYLRTAGWLIVRPIGREQIYSVRPECVPDLPAFLVTLRQARVRRSGG